MSDDEAMDELVAQRAALFSRMAEQILLNKDAKFGGAFLMIPPDQGEPFSSLMLNQEEPSIFWAAVKTLADVAMGQLDRAQRGQQGFR